MIVDTTDYNYVGGKQGFITNRGEFLSRVEAAKAALEEGQLDRPLKELFSEDLW